MPTIAPDIGNYSRRISVAIAVLRDPQGRILVQRRTPGQALEGWWEFPGGKRESGETLVQTIKRELEEELGIDAADALRDSTAADAVRVLHSYDSGVLIDLHAFSLDIEAGEVLGRENQTVVWAERGELSDLQLLPASWDVLRMIEGETKLALVDDDFGAIEALRAAGSLVRTMGTQSLAGEPNLVVTARTLSAIAKAPTHRRWHLPERVWRGCRSRPYDRRWLLGVSVHDCEGLALASKWGADYALLSPVAADRHGRQALGWEAVGRWLNEMPHPPVYLLGGLTQGDVARARACGALGIAAMGDVVNWCH